MPLDHAPDLETEQFNQITFDLNDCCAWVPTRGTAAHIFLGFDRVNVVHVYSHDNLMFAWVKVVHKNDHFFFSPFWRFYEIETWEGEVSLSRVYVDGQELTEERYQQFIEDGRMTRPTPDFVSLIEVMQQKHDHIRKCKHRNLVEIDSGYPVPPRGQYRVQCQDCGKKFWRSIQEKAEE